MSTPGQDGESVDSTILLLSHSSKMIQLFNDKLTISSLNDTRLQELSSFLNFLSQWKTASGRDGKKFISEKLYFDLQSMIYGFQGMVATKLKEFKNATIKPAIINQDIVENHFCQVRSCNGQSNNPTWRLQEACQSSIRHGQTTISRKSNAGMLSVKKKV